LQTVYEAFDKIAKHRRVFKIETIGDWWAHRPRQPRVCQGDA
jgi:hypothetical protein